jgi:hypothetical protein
LYNLYSHIKTELTFYKLYSLIYKDSKARIKLGSIGEEFKIQKGVRQGDPLTPKLFTTVLEQIFRKLGCEEKGLNINGEYLHYLRFADDIVLLSEKHTELQDMIIN